MPMTVRDPTARHPSASFSRLGVVMLVLCLAMPSAASGWQSTSTTVNGVPLEIRSSIVPAKPEIIEQSIRASWEASGSETRRFELPGGRTVLGRIKGIKHETVMLREGPQAGTTEMHVTVSDLGKPLRAPAAPPFKMPVGMQVNQSMEFSDPQQSRVVTFQLSSPARVAFVANAVLKAMQDARWTLQHQFTYGASPSEEARAFMGARDRSEISVMVVPAERGSSVWVILEEAAP